MTEPVTSDGEQPTLVSPAVCVLDIATGAMTGHTGVKRTTIGDLDGWFSDREAFARITAQRGSETAYEVQEFRPTREAPQELIFGTSTLFPGKVGGEFFLTRGHLHRRADRPEIYACQRGHGVIHLETLSGKTQPVAMTAGSVVYIPPYWIHRSVNVGGEPLVTLFCYPADSGQDYAIIEHAHGMRTLIVDDGAGGWKEVDNPDYRPRSADEQRRYLGG